MTEDEARQKWCPMVRISDGAERDHGVNRRWKTGEPLEEHKCIASDCMMWRWSKKGFDGVKTSDQDTGYCGLAGKS